MRGLLAVMFSWMFLSCFSCTDRGVKIIDKKIKKEDAFEFYDFQFNFEIYDQDLGLKEELIYDGNLSNDTDFKILYITYYEGRKKLTNPIREEISISSMKLDSIYSILVRRLQPNYNVNRDSVRIPSIQNYDSEWEYGVIKLDMGYRGDLYSIKTLNYKVTYKELWSQLR